MAPERHPYPDFFGTAYPDFPSDPNKCWEKNLFGPCGKRLGRSPHRTQLAQESRFPHNSETGRKAPPPPTRGVQTGPAREGPAPSGRSTRSARRRGDTEIVFKVGEPRGGTRARASGLYMSRPRHRMPSPALFPNARGLPCERGVDGPEKHRARVPAPLHAAPRRCEMRFHRVIILTMPRLRVRQVKPRHNDRDVMRFYRVIILPEGRILPEIRRGAWHDGFGMVGT